MSVFTEWYSRQAVPSILQQPPKRSKCRQLSSIRLYWAEWQHVITGQEHQQTCLFHQSFHCWNTSQGTSLLQQHKACQIRLTAKQMHNLKSQHYRQHTYHHSVQIYPQNRQTDQPWYSIRSNRLHLASTVLWPNNSMTRGQSNLTLECGPMPNVMAALPNIGGAICSTPQSLANA